MGTVQKEKPGAPFGPSPSYREKEMTATQRIAYVDAVRAYAILLVVVSHVFAPVSAALLEYPAPVWWFFNLFNSAIRLCVPLFVMISGKLLLGSSREEPYLQEIGRRFSRIVPPFFAWSMIYAAYEARMAGEAFSWADALRQFFQGPTEFHLWFMYMILGVYLIAPFLRRFVRAARRQDLEALLGFWLAFLILGFAVPAYASTGPAATLVGYGGYFVLGYYLDKEAVFEGKRRELLGISAAIVFINALATYRLALAQDGVVDQKYYGGLAPLVAIYAACFFLVLKRIDYDRLFADHPAVRRLTHVLSLDSYNIYLIHVFFIWLLIKGHLGFVLSERTGGNPWLGVALTSAAVLAGSLALSRALSKIPLLRKVLVVRS
jgi:surface polysaccharide O-acyltransferase-like enzyme